MENDIYIIDANAATKKVLGSELSIEIIEEIIYELKSRTDIKIIKSKMVESIFDDTLQLLHDHVPKLINMKILNLEEGNGDAMLVAYFLSNKNKQNSLFNQKKILVTQDRKLRDYFKSIDLEAITINELNSVIDSQ